MEFPVDIMLDILTRLPTDSVLESKLVSKYWRDVVRHPSFSQKHFNRLISAADDSGGNLGFIFSADTHRSLKEVYYFEYNGTPITSPRKINLGLLCAHELRYFNVVDSCNGLICLVNLGSFVICNPITREILILPESMFCRFYGFGYLASTNEYKVVRIYESEEQLKSWDAEVYTLGSGNGWRNLGRLDSGFYSPRMGVRANGALHWMIRGKRMSMAFDLADEKFREISIPEIPQRPNRDGDFYLVGSLGDSLMCVEYRGMRSGRSLGIWLLKENGYSDMNWEAGYKSMSLSEEFDVRNMEPFAFTNSGAAVLCFKIFNTDFTIYRYDFKLSSLEMLLSFDKKVYRPPLSYMKTLVSLEALGEEVVSLEALGEEDTERME